MADTRGIRAGRAYVELGTADKLSAGLLAAQQKLEAFGAATRKAGAALFGIGATAVGGMFAAAKSFANAGDGLDEMSARTGASVESLSALLYVMKLNGASADDMEKGIRNMQRTLVAAGAGSGEAVGHLRALGLTFAELQGLAPDEQLKVIADRFGGLADEGQRTAVAMGLFGKAGTTLIPTLDLGARGIDALMQKARDLGLVMSGPEAKAASEFNDSLDTLQGSAMGLVRTLGSALVPVFQSVARWITSATLVIRDYLKEHGPLIVASLKVAAVVAAVGTALYAVGVAAKVAAIGVALVRGVIAAATNIFSLAKSAITAMSNPLVAAATAAIALAGTIAVTSGVAGDAVNWLTEQFGGLTEAMDAATKKYDEILAGKFTPPDLSGITSAAAGAARASVSVQSQFGGTDIALKGVGRGQDQTAQNTKKTADNTQRMLRVLQGGGATTTPTWG